MSKCDHIRELWCHECAPDPDEELKERVAELEKQLADAKKDAADEAHDKVMFSLVSSMGTRCRELEDQRDDLRKQVEMCARIDAFRNMLEMLRMNATDPGAARNYVQIGFAWDKAWSPGLPFKNCVVTFLREGGKMPAQLVREIGEQREKLAEIARELVKALPEEGRQVYLNVIADCMATPFVNLDLCKREAHVVSVPDAIALEEP